MKPELKEFIKSHLDLIDNEQYEQLYKKYDETFYLDVKEDGLASPRHLSEFLLSCNINPLNYVTTVPKNYLTSSTLTNIDIPEGIKIIDRNAFALMQKLSSVIIPESCTRVEDYAFNCCKELNTVTILNKNTKFGNKVFYLCFTLLDIYYPGTINEYRNIMSKDDYQIYTVHCTDGDYIVDRNNEVYSV